MRLTEEQKAVAAALYPRVRARAGQLAARGGRRRYERMLDHLTFKMIKCVARRDPARSQGEFAEYLAKSLKFRPRPPLPRDEAWMRYGNLDRFEVEPDAGRDEGFEDLVHKAWGDRKKGMLRRLFVDDYTQAEVAAQDGYSRSETCRIVQQAYAEIREKYQP